MVGIGEHVPLIVCGVAGKFPESDGLAEFCANLYERVDMVTDCARRWSAETYKIPRRMGQLKNLDKFDADFFGVHGKQAENMDPRLRFLLEVAQECITDAGINILELSGSNTGVYVGASGEEALEYFKGSSDSSSSGYGLPGAVLSTLANRLSFHFNLNGSSMSIDTACSSSLMALEQAVLAIRFGKCDSALVAGVHLCLDPRLTSLFTNLGMAAADGKCKSFDSTADGYARSEAVVAIYICKEDVARRRYATILHAGSNTDGNKVKGYTYPSGELQEKLMRQVYAEAGINPKDVGYVEAHGTGTQAGDVEEVNAIARVFCEDRKPGKPLLLGSVKSNMGHSEPASGLCGIAKLIIIAQTRIIPGNLHFSNPNPKILALLDGRIRVVSSNTPFEGDLVGISSFGFGGSNVHAILRLGPAAEAETRSAWKSQIPPILPLSGRTEDVGSSLEKLAGMGDYTVAHLLHCIAVRDVPSHGFRSFVIADGKNPLSVSTSAKVNKKESSALWFVFSGMGTQYQGMANDMMKLGSFRASIDNSISILKKSGFDLATVLFAENSETLNDALNSAVSIVALQIALVDLLEAVGVVPDKMVGHSLGEIAIAYADKCLIVEQTLKVALVRGRACRLAEPGAMASVGLSWKEALERCPEHVSPACDNSADNVTVSGKEESVQDFVRELQRQGVFAKAVQSSGMAFHSRHMEPSSAYMRKHFPVIIPDPKPRSSKWISTSCPESEIVSSVYKLCSVDYLVNNVLAPVRFREAIGLIEGHAVVLEIAPHCLLQAILKRALPKSVSLTAVMNKKATSNSRYFLEALGQVYLGGYNPNFGALYEHIQFPLGPSTPMISPFIQWDHSHNWTVPVHKETEGSDCGAKILICPKNESDKFYLDHIIDGRTLFPAVGYMYLVWSFFAKSKGKKAENCAIIFQNVRFQRASIVSAEVTTEFHVVIHPGSGDFEVFEGDSAVCVGSIQEYGSSNGLATDWSQVRKISGKSDIIADGFYKLSRLRGYGHIGVFASIEKADPAGDWAEVGWKNNWVGFLDQFLQIQEVLVQGREGLFVPVEIQKAVFEPQVLTSYLSTNHTMSVPTKTLKHIKAIVAPGIEFCGIKGSRVPKKNKQHTEIPKLSAYRHLPYVNLGKDHLLGFQEYLTFCLNIAMDNTAKSHFNVLEFMNMDKEILCSHMKTKIAPKFENSELFLVSNFHVAGLQDIHVITSANLKKIQTRIGPNLIIVTQDDISLAEGYMNGGNFLLCVRVKETGTVLGKCPQNYQVVARQPGLDLYRRSAMLPSAFEAIEIKTEDFSWVEEVKHRLCQSVEKSRRLYLYSNSSISGLHGLVQCLRKEGYNQLRCFELLDEGVELTLDFDYPSNALKEMLAVDLVHNVYSSGAWGCLTGFSIDANSEDIRRGLGPHSLADLLLPGDLSSLKWIESPLESKGPESGDHLFCEVHYSALNFRDVMIATGKLSRDALPGDSSSSGDSILGLEYSGVLRGGGVQTRLCGIQASKCLATAVQFHRDLGLTWCVPTHWTLAEAATVPCAYGTAYYALVVKGKIKEGESVLIHSGAGGVGQAAIAVALSRKCRVITTVSTEAKRAFLKSRFPQLTDACFSDSRNPIAFEEHVMKVTSGRGVNVVLNSLSQESLQASVRCLASSGRFLEIGKFDLFNNSKLGMALFLRSVEFHGVLLDCLLLPQLPPTTLKENKKLHQLILEGIDSGVVTPLPFREYDSSQLEEAVRFMASGKHLGKLLVKVRDNPQLLPNIPALPRIYFQSHKVYILVGGLGGMGLEIGSWMINRGARNLVFVSRSSDRSWYQENRLQNWRVVKGASIFINTSDMATPEGVSSLLAISLKIGPIGGVFNLAVELKDAILENQTSQNFQAVARPKIQATLLLDQFTRELATNVDYFVVFSSIVCLLGNAGQSNYGYSNSAMERICSLRRAAGFHGLAIQWGPIGDVGIYHSQTKGEQVSIAGCAPQRISSVLEMLDVLLKSSAAVVSSFVGADSSSIKSKDLDVADTLVELAARVLGILEISHINTEDSFMELGMDSLMVTEMKQLLEGKLGVSLPAQRIMDMTFARLVEMEALNDVSPVESNEKDVQKPTKSPLVLPKSTLIPMESRRTKFSNLFLVHPIEGNLRMLEGLVNNFDCRVFGLECTPIAPLSSLTALASLYVKSIKAVQTYGPYSLAGYSFGGAVACEIAIQLEEQGLVVERLLMLDSSPGFPRMFSEMMSKSLNSSGDTLGLLCFIFTHSDQNWDELVADLMTMSTWEEKLDFVAAKLIQLYPGLSAEDIKKLGMVFVKRVSAGQDYYPSAKIKAKTVLIRSGRSGYDSVLGHDYGLKEICATQVKVIVVNGHHNCFCEQPTELQIAQIINDVLN